MKRYDIPEGAVFRPCQECRTPITFVRSDKGKSLPVTKDGISHYATCTNPKRFSKARA